MEDNYTPLAQWEQELVGIEVKRAEPVTPPVESLTFSGNSLEALRLLAGNVLYAEEHNYFNVGSISRDLAQEIRAILGS